MNRRLSMVLGLVAAGALGISLSSCNNPVCGEGTVQKQGTDGKLACVPADYPAPLTPCDTDGGNAVIVGGKCVSAIQCDPATTTVVNGICVGIGGSAPMCHQPATGKACIDGHIYNFKDHAKNAVAVTVDLFDATQLLQGKGPIMTVQSSSDGQTFVFQDFTPPPLGTVVIMTHATSPTVTINAGTGGQGVSGNTKYTIDAYAIPKTDADAWGFDYATGGGQIALYFSDPKPTSPTMLLANETTPVAGVTMMKDGAPADGMNGHPLAKYFDDTLTAVGTGTTTGAKGAAIVASPIPTGGTFPSFSGMGGGVTTWETLPGGSAPGVVIITRFHPN